MCKNHNKKMLFRLGGAFFIINENQIANYETSLRLTVRL